MVQRSEGLWTEPGRRHAVPIMAMSVSERGGSSSGGEEDGILGVEVGSVASPVLEVSRR